MRDKANRDVTVYDIVVKAEPEQAPKKTLDFFLDKIVALYGDGSIDNTIKRYKNHNIYIRGLETDEANKAICLLLYFEDKDGMGISITDLDTDNHEQNDIALEDNQARPESVHVIISKESQQNSPNAYLTIIEDASKLNRGRISSYFNSLVRGIQKAFQKEFESAKENGARKADGSQQTYYYKNKVEFQGHLSQELLECIENGKLKGIALETLNSEKLAIADGRYVSAKRQDLFLKPATGKWSEDSKDKISDALGIGKKNKYETARITFDTNDGKSHTARIDTETGNTVGDGFVRKHRLKGFSKFFNEADANINPEIRTKMLDLLKTIKGGSTS